MSSKYLWQKNIWPKFTWDSSRLLKSLSSVKKSQGEVLATARQIDLRDLGEIIATEALETSAIEGEKLDINDVRSSVAKRLGLPTAGLPESSKSSDAVVEILIDATTNYNNDLTHDRLYSWHACLFPSGHSGMQKIEVGKYRTSTDAMRVVSGKMGKERTHYIAPPSDILDREMNSFLLWFNNESKELDGYLRAAIAHFWFVSIHPFDDGNGRIARVITDMAIAQDEQVSKRLYSLSNQIRIDRTNYYEILEKTQKEDGDLSDWVLWFLDTISESIKSSKRLIERSLFMAKYYEHIADLKLNDRQKKVLKKLLELLPNDFQGGLTNKKYVAITKTSSETAKRDLKDLVEKDLILKNDGAGRSTSYRLNKEI